jgi:hypothetical protein
MHRGNTEFGTLDRQKDLGKPDKTAEKDEFTPAN